MVHDLFPVAPTMRTLNRARGLLSTNSLWLLRWTRGRGDLGRFPVFTSPARRKAHIARHSEEENGSRSFSASTSPSVKISSRSFAVRVLWPHSYRAPGV